MASTSRAAAAFQDRSTAVPRGAIWPARAAAGLCGAAAAGMLAAGLVLPGAGIALAAVAIAVMWASPRSRPRRGLGPQMLARASLGDPDLYLDLDAVQVQAVYQLGPELYAHLRGGVGQRLDPHTGNRRSIETSDVSLTWRCTTQRGARRLAGRLNQWEANGTPLRLLAMRGRCALLLEDDDEWVTLPELRLAA